MADVTSLTMFDHPFMQGVLATIVGGLGLVFLLWLTRHGSRLGLAGFNQLAGWLASVKGLRGLAIRAYKNNVSNRYGTVSNVYLGETEHLDLETIFVPLALRMRFLHAKNIFQARKTFYKHSVGFETL